MRGHTVHRPHRYESSSMCAGHGSVRGVMKAMGNVSPTASWRSGAITRPCPCTAGRALPTLSAPSFSATDSMHGTITVMPAMSARLSRLASRAWRPGRATAVPGTLGATTSSKTCGVRGWPWPCLDLSRISYQLRRNATIVRNGFVWSGTYVSELEECHRDLFREWRWIGKLAHLEAGGLEGADGALDVRGRNRQ